MKKHIIALLGLTMVATTAVADDWNDESYCQGTQPGDIYGGVGLGLVQVENNKAQEDAHNMSAFVGAPILVSEYGSLVVDTSYSRTMLQKAKSNLGTKYRMDLVSAHLAYQTPTRVYLRARAGMMYSWTKLLGNGEPDRLESNTEFSWGAGIGMEVFKDSGVHLVLDYTTVQEDVNLIGLALVFN